MGEAGLVLGRASRSVASPGWGGPVALPVLHWELLEPPVPRGVLRCGGDEARVRMVRVMTPAIMVTLMSTPAAPHHRTLTRRHSAPHLPCPALPGLPGGARRARCICSAAAALHTNKSGFAFSMFRFPAR